MEDSVSRYTDFDQDKQESNSPVRVNVSFIDMSEEQSESSWNKGWTNNRRKLSSVSTEYQQSLNQELEELISRLQSVINHQTNTEREIQFHTTNLSKKLELISALSKEAYESLFDKPLAVPKSPRDKKGIWKKLVQGTDSGITFSPKDSLAFGALLLGALRKVSVSENQQKVFDLSTRTSEKCSELQKVESDLQEIDQAYEEAFSKNQRLESEVARFTEQVNSLRAHLTQTTEENQRLQDLATGKRKELFELRKIMHSCLGTGECYLGLHPTLYESTSTRDSTPRPSGQFF